MAGCSSCSTTTGSSGGCNNNGTCGTSDCNKMNAFDWLSHMGIPTVDKFDIVEVKFKGGRKEYYRNVDFLPLTTGDPIVVDVPNGHHIGYVSLQGELVRLQMQKRKIKNDDNILRIYRVATQKDLEKWEEARNREIPTLYRAKQIIDEMKLEMKLSDVEFQSDNSKATFFYSAEDRVDFRELIKSLASEFKIRVEMRQISLRQEAGRLGGIGVCGRELCCSTWIYEFKSVNTSAARYQNLSLNPSKLSGQCGRLKCCLNYELDTYMAALSDIPEVEKPLQTELGPAKLQKTDIFRKLMWFSYNNDNNWHSITCERVKEIQELNAKGTKPANLTSDHTRELEDKISKSNLELEILDKKFATTKKSKKKKKPRPDNNNSNVKKESPSGSVQPTPRSNPNQNRPGRNKQRRDNPDAKSSGPPIEAQSDKSKNPESTPGQKPKNKRNNKRRFNPKNRGDQNQGQ
ncbi:Cell fate regulator YaaT, PSP1 superfamily (controls sporulation, competence, biofilm development) [Aquiflexum balticum DSM 16537]|uniref:Cell fate regulator YaaT, PSP1 superfamily (Controls sporulation, competence, biofilm development) n=2 Tax=Aquiflexum TaxID=280472 RepID=A0A1W2H5H5_9BACT|nr:regulatory iron-sulfur-containing complex subunit RicT [Aquiflexum balticum]SMD43868.1 Cell fate regulator YaaT, PSP1 superfamily (controls sporulation, competence, biofilm development) [Aquiflexum balticum DSM 16537]